MGPAGLLRAGGLLGSWGLLGSLPRVRRLLACGGLQGSSGVLQAAADAAALRPAPQAEQELQRSRDAVRELRAKCKELAGELEHARRRPGGGGSGYGYGGSSGYSRPSGGSYGALGGGSGSKYPSRPSPGASRPTSRGWGAARCWAGLGCMLGSEAAWGTLVLVPVLPR